MALISCSLYNYNIQVDATMSGCRTEFTQGGVNKWVNSIKDIFKNSVPGLKTMRTTRWANVSLSQGEPVS